MVSSGFINEKVKRPETSGIMFGQSDLSEHREQNFIVQVSGFGTNALDFGYYSRQAVVTEKKGWSEWEQIDSSAFQHIDKQARTELGNNKDASPLYAKFYLNIIK